MPTITQCRARPWLISTSNNTVGNCGFAGALMALLDRLQRSGDTWSNLPSYLVGFHRNQPKQVLNALSYCFQHRTIFPGWGGGWGYKMPGTTDVIPGSADYWRIHKLFFTSENRGAPRNRTHGEEDYQWVQGLQELYRLWSVANDNGASWQECIDYSSCFDGWQRHTAGPSQDLHYQEGPNQNQGPTDRIRIHGDLAVPVTGVDALLRLVGLQRESVLPLSALDRQGRVIVGRSGYVNQTLLCQRFITQIRALQTTGLRGNLIPQNSDGAFLGIGEHDDETYDHQNWQDDYQGVLHWVYIPFHRHQLANRQIAGNDIRVWTWGAERSFFTDQALSDYSPMLAVFLHRNFTF
ncbi:hypothetical protein [Haliangium ochraceum]|uniref:Uncharacterized protein n=1 Tax=Haliangium ochraceum (strain DSM 14365 / JCM 11303 / SMP-2) TaxID=502025 RepID=D0LGC0_HALO1|nr:hypothetical protein [Haliangium ochraceum]ACY18145.1 hypothetical protein Hoch_5668 [Haliangium ochraceum DSM 14365]